MKKLFFSGLLLLVLYEAAAVYLIMPMPGSQNMNSLEAAYFLFNWRWPFRIVFMLMVAAGGIGSSWTRKWIPVLTLLISSGVVYLVNFILSADHMFYKPEKLLMKSEAEDETDPERLVIAVVHNGEARAYPIRYLGYHHQVLDTIAGTPILVTYCTVCRTGRVFEPKVNGHAETFRLVGMDHFNAMFEDATTKSWWRQATGEAVAGKLKGSRLPEIMSTQTTLKTWLSLQPNSLIMQADPAFLKSYDTTSLYERGKSRKRLTGTDSLSWNKKSWVIGVRVGPESRAYDWNRLKKDRLIEDHLGKIPLVIVLASDTASFFAFQKYCADCRCRIENDTLKIGTKSFRLDGTGIDTACKLKQIQAYQEFWHSWKSFNPATTVN